MSDAAERRDRGRPRSPPVVAEQAVSDVALTRLGGKT